MEIFQSINPYDGQILEEHELHNATDVERILTQAYAVKSDWKRMSFAQRATYFFKLASGLRTHKEKIALMMTHEMGKILAESRAEVEKCAGQCEFFAQNAESFLKPRSVTTDAQRSYVLYEPVGTVFAIMPWNFPLWQVFRYAVPALMAGNTTILKHAPNVLGCGKLIESLFLEAGFPKGVFQLVVVDVPMVESIIADSRIGMVTLTGSEKAGASVAALAGKYIKKSVLELGGSDPLLVFEDADLDKASSAAITSRFMNSGQVCIAAKRWLVHQNVHAQFVDLVTEKMKSLTTGDPTLETTKLGPMARLDLALQLKSQLDKSIANGAELVCGGTLENNFFAPTLLTNVLTTNLPFQEELFGPVASVSTFSDVEEALLMANMSPYGLSAAVWTNHMETMMTTASALEAGSVFYNAVVKSDARLPIGGIKKSGYGRELSEEGIREFCSSKTIFIG